MREKIIPFMMPDITQAEIDEVTDTLRSGWITTGSKTKQFEEKISGYCNAEKTACLNSATSCLGILLRLFDIKKGDEVITTPYTFASTMNEIIHCGARPVFVDIKDDFNIDPGKLRRTITKKTKAVIPTDIGGWPCDYDEIKEAIAENRHKFKADRNSLQRHLDRILLISDSAHSLGATYKGGRIGSISDFTIFSFHATKNLTTAEGGAVTFNRINDLSSEEIYRQIMLLSLHGQDRDAYSKLKLGGWKYSIEFAGYKCNIPDLSSSVGLSQIKRYDIDIIRKRKQLFELYIEELGKDGKFILPNFKNDIKETSYHLFLLRICDYDEARRDEAINKLGEYKIAANVHYMPLPMHPAYNRLGFKIDDFPISYSMYKNEITLPLYSQMCREDALYVCEKLKAFV